MVKISVIIRYNFLLLNKLLLTTYHIVFTPFAKHRLVFNLVIQLSLFGYAQGNHCGSALQAR